MTSRGTTYSSSPAGTYNWTAQYGGKPIVPDPTATANSAISGNLANLGSLQNLASQTNAFNVGQMNTALGGLIPDYANLRTTQSNLIGDYLSGNVPTDVQNAIAQSAAERGITTGVGSPNSNAALLRAMGLTSLDLQNRGIQGLQTAISETPTPQLFNLQSMMTNPSDVQSAQMASNIYASMPDPEAAAKLAMSLAYGKQNKQTGTNWASINPSPTPSPGNSQNDYMTNWASDVPSTGWVSMNAPGGLGGAEMPEDIMSPYQTWLDTTFGPGRY